MCSKTENEKLSWTLSLAKTGSDQNLLDELVEGMVEIFEACHVLDRVVVFFHEVGEILGILRFRNLLVLASLVLCLIATLLRLGSSLAHRSLPKTMRDARLARDHKEEIWCFLIG
jgi:hypothetical protein